MNTPHDAETMCIACALSQGIRLDTQTFRITVCPICKNVRACGEPKK